MRVFFPAVDLIIPDKRPLFETLNYYFSFRYSELSFGLGVLLSKAGKNQKNFVEIFGIKVLTYGQKL